MWGEYNEGGRVPPAVRTVLRNFTAAGMRIATHVVGRELWVWKTEERCASRLGCSDVTQAKAQL